MINGKKWFKIMANIQLTEMDSLIDNSWINYILLKQILFMTQANIKVRWYIHYQLKTKMAVEKQ